MAGIIDLADVYNDTPSNWKARNNLLSAVITNVSSSNLQTIMFKIL